MSVRFRNILVAFALTSTLTPAALAGGDLRSPDTRDAAEQASRGGDLRSPDTRDAAARVSTPVSAGPTFAGTPAGRSGGDLRSPDTRDAAAAASITGAVQTLAAPSAGFDWGDAGVGAAAALGLVAMSAGLLAFGGMVVRTRHH